MIIKNIRLLIILFCFSLVVNSSVYAFNNVKKGDKALTFSTNKITDETFSLNDYLGKKSFVLFFWKLELSKQSTEGESAGKSYDASAKWIQEIAILQKLYDKYKTNGIEIIAITAPVKSLYDKQNKIVKNPDFTPEEIIEIKKYLSENGINFTIVLDPTLSIYNSYGIVPFPSTAIVNSEGVIVFEVSSFPTFGGENILEENIKIAVGLTKPAISKDEKYIPKGKASDYYKKAVQLREKDKIDETIEQLILAVKDDPLFVEPHKMLATLYREKKQTENAMVELATLLDIEPANPRNHILYGDFSLENGMIDDAKKEYEMAIKSDTTGMKYVGRGGDEKTRVRKVASGDGYYGLGMIALKEKKKDEAVEYFKKALTYFEGNTSEGDMFSQFSSKKEIHPNQPKTHYELGLIYLEKGDEDNAIKEFKIGISSYQDIIKKILKNKLY